jgi:hypothetical protein
MDGFVVEDFFCRGGSLYAVARCTPHMPHELHSGSAWLALHRVDACVAALGHERVLVEVELLIEQAVTTVEALLLLC